VKTGEKLKSDACKARHNAYVHIGQARIGIQELKHTQIREILVEYERVIFVTANSRYVVVEANYYQDSGPLIETEEQLDIDEAHEAGVLPEALYEAVRDAEKAYDVASKEQQRLCRLREVISENGGPDNVKKILEGGDL